MDRDAHSLTRCCLFSRACSEWGHSSRRPHDLPAKCIGLLRGLQKLHRSRGLQPLELHHSFRSRRPGSWVRAERHVWPVLLQDHRRRAGKAERGSHRPFDGPSWFQCDRLRQRRDHRARVQFWLERSDRCLLRRNSGWTPACTVAGHGQPDLGVAYDRPDQQRYFPKARRRFGEGTGLVASMRQRPGLVLTSAVSHLNIVPVLL
jgi:hypothetical protein